MVCFMTRSLFGIEVGLIHMRLQMSVIIYDRMNVALQFMQVECYVELHAAFPSIFTLTTLTT